MTVQRNDPCPCGSGRKYKRCCKREASASSKQLSGSKSRTQASTQASTQAHPETPALHPAWVLKISLDYIQPEIWRRVVVPPTMKLFELHRLIQSFGWFDCHLWAFRDATTNRALGELILTPKGPRRLPSPFDSAPGPDAKKVMVGECFDTFGDEILYEYDFGDGWIHRIRLENEFEFPDPFQPTVLAGANAFPPEDCGGPPGYARLQAFCRDGKDPHGDEDYEEWAADQRIPRLKKADVPRGYPVLSKANRTALQDPEALAASTSESTAKPPEPINPLSRPLLHELHRRLRATVEEFDHQFGLQTFISNPRFTDYNATLKIETAALTKDGVALTKAAITYLDRAETLGLNPSWLGKTFTCGNDEVCITGLNPRAKESVLLESLPEPGKPSQTFKMHPERVAAFFKLPTKTAAPDPDE